MVANLDLHLHTYLFTHTHGLPCSPMFDVSNIDMWKLRMSAYLKTLSLHVYFTATKKSYLANSKYIEANAQDLTALRNTLSEDYLMMVSHCDFAFVVCVGPKGYTLHLFKF